MKMPADSSIYWDSVGSQRSASGGSTGSVSRHYVDPWDLENYAYLRRHSVAGLTQQASRQHRRSTYHRLSQDVRVYSDCWCSSSTREPGYMTPAFVEDLYGGPVRLANNSCYYHQSIYEDEIADYVAPFPAYPPLSEVRHDEFAEDQGRCRHRYKSRSTKDLQRSMYVDRIPPVDDVELDITEHRSRSQYRSLEQEKCSVHIVPPTHLDLNTYGHLKIDYTNSWNSLNRKISK